MMPSPSISASTRATCSTWRARSKRHPCCFNLADAGSPTIMRDPRRRAGALCADADAGVILALVTISPRWPHPPDAHRLPQLCRACGSMSRRSACGAHRPQWRGQDQSAGGDFAAGAGPGLAWRRLSMNWRAMAAPAAWAIAAELQPRRGRSRLAPAGLPGRDGEAGRRAGWCDRRPCCRKVPAPRPAYAHLVADPRHGPPVRRTRLATAGASSTAWSPPSIPSMARASLVFEKVMRERNLSRRAARRHGLARQPRSPHGRSGGGHCGGPPHGARSLADAISTQPARPAHFPGAKSRVEGEIEAPAVGTCRPCTRRTNIVDCWPIRGGSTGQPGAPWRARIGAILRWFTDPRTWRPNCVRRASRRPC